MAINCQKGPSPVAIKRRDYHGLYKFKRKNGEINKRI